MSGRIVVGYDGSAAARDALRWAAEEAQLRRATLEIVNAWEIPAVVTGMYPVDVAADMTLAAKELVTHAVATLAVPAEMRVEPRVEQGEPGLMLTQLAHGADLLVVGSRGHRGLGGLLLGSVSSYCVHHATCPVVVIRHQT